MPRQSEPTWEGAREEVLRAILMERSRQVSKWGYQDHDLDRWLTILTEEVGELAKAILELDAGMYDEAIQVAAVAAAIAQSIRTGRPA